MRFPPDPAGQVSGAAAENAELKASLEAATSQCQQLEERAAGLDAELATAQAGLEGKHDELAATAAELAAAQEQVAGLTGGWGWVVQGTRRVNALLYTPGTSCAASCLGRCNEFSPTGLQTIIPPSYPAAAELGAAQEQVAGLTAQLAALADAKAGVEGAQAEVAAQLAQLQVGGWGTSGWAAVDMQLLLLLLPKC